MSRSRPDPHAAAAAEHVRRSEQNLHNVAEKIAAFRRLSADEQRQILAELDARAERRQAGAFSMATSTLMTVAATFVTVFAAVYVALLNGFFTSVAPLIDPQTGLVRGDEPRDTMNALSTLQFEVLIIAGILVCLALATSLYARDTDRRRALCITWARLYREALEGADNNPKKVRWFMSQRSGAQLKE
ncbi:hypothetical protein [Leifsonia shinshuensis]|uniref:Uncharacterized protein n=1 Tax=Leifsonia shinshuensis TaxID=150026 RepID=A0A853D0S3_9MICO|nr:hypothetical protein [Leifsonia shinshuensis]NYJ25024.1 hypothetical protein [Leifsonia shinshuensis]